VRSEWHVEFTTLIEAAKSVEAGAVQIIKELRRFCALPAIFVDQFVEAFAVAIEGFLVILHLDCYLEALLQLSVKVYQVRIDVVEDRCLRLQTQGDCESAAERLNETCG
jgi:hypothetical protein